MHQCIQLSVSFVILVLICSSRLFALALAVPMSDSNNKKDSSASAAAPPANGASEALLSDTSRRAIDFLTWARGLKTTARTGWVMREVPNPESVADHSWRITLMAMIAGNSSQGNNVDVMKCIKMALVHDLAEASVGDITPHCGVSSQEKHEMELSAMSSKTNGLSGALGGDEILALWREYEEGTTPEAKLVKDLDKLEMILQAQEYEGDGERGKSLHQFFTSTRGKWQTSLGEAWAQEIESRRTTKDDNSGEGDSAAR